MQVSLQHPIEGLQSGLATNVVHSIGSLSARVQGPDDKANTVDVWRSSVGLVEELELWPAADVLEDRS